MVDSTVPQSPQSPPLSTSIRRASTFADRPSASSHRFSPSNEPPTPGIRRRSSNLSEFSNEARRQILTSTDDLLNPRPGAGGLEGDAAQTQRDATHWDSAPLAFALLPALGGLVFKNGSSVVTDVMLLGLAAIFLNWSVRIPWDWYHSAQTVRKGEEEYNEALTSESDDELSSPMSHSQTTLEEVPEESTTADEAASSPPPPKHHHAQQKATSELYKHEIIALLCCFLFPILGAYLLHTLRSQLSRPSEGLVSNYNLTIFLLASEIRPLSQIVKLIRARTLHLQRVVASEPLTSASTISSKEDMQEVMKRISDLENKPSSPTSAFQSSDPNSNSKIVSETRRTLQPELDALNRAVRRYEKRATLQAFQTESRLKDIESRLNDAVSLAAAAANGGLARKGKGIGSGVVGVFGTVGEWLGRMAVLPVKVLGMVVMVPFKVGWGMVEGGWGRLSEMTSSGRGKERRGDKGKVMGSAPGIGGGSVRREGHRRGEIVVGRSGKKVG